MSKQRQRGEGRGCAARQRKSRGAQVPPRLAGRLRSEQRAKKDIHSTRTQLHIPQTASRERRAAFEDRIRPSPPCLHSDLRHASPSGPTTLWLDELRAQAAELRSATPPHTCSFATCSFARLELEPEAGGGCRGMAISARVTACECGHGLMRARLRQPRRAVSMCQIDASTEDGPARRERVVQCLRRSRGLGELSTSVSKSPPVRGAQVRSHGLGGHLRAGFEARAHAHHRLGCAPRDERWGAGAVDDRDRARCRDWLSAFLHAWRGEVQWRISSQLAQQSR